MKTAHLMLKTKRGTSQAGTPALREEVPRPPCQSPAEAGTWGSPRNPVEALVAPREGELVEMIHSFNELTERLKHSHETLGHEVRRLREQLEEKDRELQRRRRLAALGEMAAGVAHEIRNPLGGIGLYASLLERELGNHPEQRETASRILAGVKGLEAIVGDILMFSGSVEPRRRRVPAGQVVHDAVCLASPQARMMNVVLESDPALESIELDCDPRQISRALLNLVLNALDAVTPGGHVAVRADSADSAAGVVGLAVEDDGPGIPHDVLDRIFDPFFTTKESGTGLGLAITHRIAEAHGGRIVARNRPEGGAGFVLIVPTWQGESRRED